MGALGTGVMIIAIAIKQIIATGPIKPNSLTRINNSSLFFSISNHPISMSCIKIITVSSKKPIKMINFFTA